MYKLIENGVIRLSDNAGIPADINNRDYRAYLEWKSMGNVPQPADYDSSSEITVSAWQFCEALNQLGLRTEVEAVIEVGYQTLKDYWHRSTEFRRYHPKIIEVAAIMGKTSTDIDAVFNLAKTLNP
jgi:hypothetical protein